VLALDYDAFLADPKAHIARLCAALGIAWDRPLPAGLPLSPMTVSRPAKDKWRRHERDIAQVWPLVAEADARAEDFLAAGHVPVATEDLRFEP
jgi:hypothetical protein